MNRITRHIVTFLFLFVFFVGIPQHASAALVSCGLTGPLNANGTQACGFPEFMKMISTIIDFLIFTVAPLIALCVILYAGFLYLTSLGEAEKRTQANGMFVKAVSGMAIAMVAWILVKFILVQLGVKVDVFPVFY
jgi:hypothetical protein